MVVSAVTRARRNWASAWENHIFGSLTQNFGSLTADMGNLGGTGGGGLGGQRGNDCRVDLSLKGCRGFRHPKIKRKGGLELA